MQYRFAKTVLTGVLVAAFTATAIAADGFLAGRHGAKGVKCEMCHVTATGGKLKMVDEGKHEVCVQCHGFYDKVVQLTETKDEQNPHAQHDGNLPCTECHKGHKKGVNYCAQCHNFEFTVP